MSASLSAVSKYLLPLASQRWVSAASILEGFDVLVCGDRVGSIHVYKFPASDRVPICFRSLLKFFNLQGCRYKTTHTLKTHFC